MAAASAADAKVKTTGKEDLKDVDPELHALIAAEKKRQVCGLELIASENFTSAAVMQCLGSCLTNKYSEGLPGKRYYGGNHQIDKIEILCQQRALKAFRLDEKEWGVNVQPYSGSPANLAVYTGLLSPHDRIMGLDLPSGGHLTHGYYTNKKRISSASIFFESFPYKVNAATGYIDYDTLEETAGNYLPKLLICGASAYPRDYDYARLRQIADKVGALLMCDMAHYAGLVAAQEMNNPFEHCHVVTTTTHKSLRGPRAAVIFFRREFEDKINFAVFPSLQGGPHNHQIAGIATQFREVMTPEFKVYAKQVKANMKALAATLMSKGYKLVTDGTDNHLILWDLRPIDLTGNKVETLCDEVSITLNKNTVYGDKSAFTPGGVRIGSPALTSRGLVEKDFELVGEFLHRVIQIALEVQKAVGKQMKDFQQALSGRADIHKLKEDVEAFASKFPMPGLDM